MRNLRTVGAGELASKGRTETFCATEVPFDERWFDERGPIIARYREVAGSYADRYFAKLPGLRDHRVFQVAQRH